MLRISAAVCGSLWLNPIRTIGVSGAVSIFRFCSMARMAMLMMVFFSAGVALAYFSAVSG